MSWKNLAPELVRQRVVIELLTDHVADEHEIRDYLKKLSSVLDMHPLQEPFAYRAQEAGFGGWIHWITSGAHAYSYTSEWTKVGKPLFSVDAYTCKLFDVERAVQFTKDYFGAKTIVWKEVGFDE